MCSFSLVLCVSNDAITGYIDQIINIIVGIIKYTLCTSLTVYYLFVNNNNCI